MIPIIILKYLSDDDKEYYRAYSPTTYSDEIIDDSDNEIVRDLLKSSSQMQQFVESVQNIMKNDSVVKKITHMLIKYIDVDLDDRGEIVYFFTSSGMNVHVYSPISFVESEQEEYARFKYNYMSPLVLLSCPHYFV